MKRILTSLILLAIATFTSQATVYRAGFRQGRFWLNNSKTVPSFDQDTYAANSWDWTLSALMCNVTGNAGAKGYSEVSGKEWQWQDYYGYAYDGEMWMEAGTTYTLGGNFDDGSAILIDGAVAWSQGNPGGTGSGYNNWVAPRTYTPDTTGWHTVKLLVWDWTGGKNITCGALSAVMWNTNGTTTASPQSGWSKFADDGSGTLFRAKLADSYITVDGIAQGETGYTLTLTSTAPQGTSVTIFTDDTDRGETDTGWTLQTGPESFDAGETQSVFVPWTNESVPTFRIHLSGTDSSLAHFGDFWEWSDSIRYAMDPTIEASLVSVTGTSGTFGVTLGYDKELSDVTPPLISLKAYYGATDGGDDATAWDAVKDFGDYNDAGTQTCALTGLTQGAVYYVRFAAKTADSDWVWSDAQSFSTAGPSLADWPASAYESDAKTQSFTVTRPAAVSAEPLTVYLSYSANATSVANGLPASVEFAAGVAEVVVPFTLLDNATADGDTTLVVNIVPNAAYSVGNPVSATIAIVDDESLVASECVWTGAGDGLTWEDAGNWTPRVPTIVDTAKFASSGLAANQSVTINGDAIIGELLIETTTAFTLAAGENGGSLELGAITRADVEGNEGNHDIRVPLKIYAGNETNCVWSINGSNNLRIYSDMEKIGDVWILKKGAATIEMRKESQAYSGPWVLEAGRISPSVKNSFKGTIYIGGTESSATFNVSAGQEVVATTQVHVYSNGVLTAGNLNNGRIDPYYVYEGGVANIGYYFYSKGVTMHGGTVNGGQMYNGGWTQNLTTKSSWQMARFNATFMFDAFNAATIDSQRGSVPVDLLITKGLTNGGSGQTLTRKGDGVIKSTANSEGLKNHVAISSGTWYVDNPGEFGLGIQETTVSAGATLGGTGCVGMKDVKSYATLALNNGSESKYATLSPGTIDETTGEHIYGTFKSGRESTHNKLTMGNWSHLEIGVGPKDSETREPVSDKLLVYGNLELGSNCVLDLVSTTTTALDKIAGGTYTLVEADAITGEFATVLKPKSGWKVAYETETVDDAEVVTRITLTVPEEATIMIFR